MAGEKQHPGATWTSREAYLLALVCLLVGLLVGYMFRGSDTPASMTAGGGAAQGAAPGGANPTAAPGESLESVTAPLLAALKADPKNVETLVGLGNAYYDHKTYPQAIDYYTRALALRPNDINVRTDLGTALWYSGMPEKAVVEYEKSLAIDPNHANTLFNMGIVRADGLHDSAGAIAAWDKLLKSHPEYPDKQRVLDLMAKARSEAK